MRRAEWKMDSLGLSDLSDLSDLSIYSNKSKYYQIFPFVMDIFGWPKEIWLRALLTLLIRDNFRLSADLAPSPCCVWTALAWDVSVNPGHSRTSKHSTLLSRECCSLLYRRGCRCRAGHTVRVRQWSPGVKFNQDLRSHGSLTSSIHLIQLPKTS